MPFVFSFGSNLQREQLRARCPSARLVGRAYLPNHRLVFVGHSAGWGGAVATVLRASGERVLGAVDEISAEDLRILDAFEGTYRRARREVVLGRARRLRPFVYLLEGRAPGSPSTAYLAALARGYRAHGYSLAALLPFAKAAS